MECNFAWATKSGIQIQHLLKLNYIIVTPSLPAKNSNTTLVKVKFITEGFYEENDGGIQIQHLLKLNFLVSSFVPLSSEFKYNTC